MARYRRRLIRTRSSSLSAVAAGLLLAAGHGATGHAGGALATGATLTSADSNVALGQQMRLRLRVGLRS